MSPKNILVIGSRFYLGDPLGKRILDAANEYGFNCQFSTRIDTSPDLRKFNLILFERVYEDYDSQSEAYNYQALKELGNAPIIKIRKLGKEIRKAISHWYSDDFAYTDLIKPDMMIFCMKVWQWYSFYHSQTDFSARRFCRFEDLRSFVLKSFTPLRQLILGMRESGFCADSILSSVKKNYLVDLSTLRYFSTGNPKYAFSILILRYFGDSTAFLNYENVRAGRLAELIFSRSLDDFFLKVMRINGDPLSLLNHQWDIPGVNSFPEWYSELAKALRV